MKPSINNFLYSKGHPTLSFCPHPVFGFRPPVSVFTDHTGSSSWITDQAGGMVEHFRYLPFGEIWTHERFSNISSRYTFSGKEKDEVTGYSYFGARYYSPELSIWLSVDPLASKYPELSPYNYCLNNPVKLVDPDGRTPWPIASTFKDNIRKIVSGFYRNSSGNLHGAVDIVHRTSRGSIPGGTVIATHDGVVTQSGTSKTAGNWVQITNGDIRTTYMHLENTPTLKIGDEVSEFDEIGTVGNTGRSEDPHLHYQIEQKNSEGEWKKINPVVGEQEKVDASMDVDLKDPQQMINTRDGNINLNSTNTNESTILGVTFE